MAVPTSRTVPPSGPLDAKIAWIGEAPGVQEVYAGKPFVGPTGYLIRTLMKGVGLDPELVYWSNVVRVNPGTFPAGSVAAQMVERWAHVLDEELLALSECEIIVACGKVALQRLTGLKGKKGEWASIVDWHGSVLRREDCHVGEEVTLWEHNQKSRGATTMDLKWPPKCQYVIPCLHPAGVLRDKGREGVPLVKRVIEKVKRLEQGRLRSYPIVGDFNPDVDTLPK